MKFDDLFNSDMTPNWGKIFSIEQFKPMLSTEQSKRVSCGDNVAAHTQKVANNMHRYLRDISVCDKNGRYYKMMMCAAICHDIGKPSTTKFSKETNDYVCNGHAVEGEKMTRLLFWDEPDIDFREDVCYMVKHHMDMYNMTTGDELYAKSIRMSWGRVCMRDMCILHHCDVYDANSKANDKYDLEDRIAQIKKATRNIGCYEKKYHFDSKRQRLHMFYNPEETIQIKNKTSFSVYVMIGLPGAGKDWWITHNKSNLPVISKERVRREMRGNTDVNDVIKKKIVSYCEDGKSFIINNLNIKKSHRDEIVRTIMPYNPNIVFVYVEAPSVKDMKKRCEGRVKPSVITRMSNEVDFPETYEYDTLIIHKQMIAQI